MATVHFAPNSAIKYVGAKSKEFHLSVARPKPMLKRGDYIIVDKKTAFNLIQKGFGEFTAVDEIKFNKDAAESAEIIETLSSENETLKVRIAELEALVSSTDLHKEDDSADSEATINADEHGVDSDNQNGE